MREIPGLADLAAYAKLSALNLIYSSRCGKMGIAERALKILAFNGRQNGDESKRGSTHYTSATMLPLLLSIKFQISPARRAMGLHLNRLTADDDKLRPEALPTLCSIILQLLLPTQKDDIFWV